MIAYHVLEEGMGGVRWETIESMSRLLVEYNLNYCRLMLGEG